MKYPLIASKLYCEPWCIRPEVHVSVCQQFRAHGSGAAYPSGGPRFGGPGDGEQMAADTPVMKEDGHPQVEVHGEVALMRVHGIIGKHLSWLEMMCGGYDIAVMERQLDLIRDDERVRTLVIDFNTPGGVGIGVGAAAQAIRNVAESGIRVIGYTDYECCSAGMWLAAGCDEFHAEGSAYVGSISTFIAAVDSSRLWEMEGLELKLFRTGELKAIGAAGKAWTEEEDTFMQETAERADASFKGWMRERRGLEDGVMNGGFWQAAHAPQGIVDSTCFPNLKSLLEAVMLGG